MTLLSIHWNYLSLSFLFGFFFSPSIIVWIFVFLTDTEWLICPSCLTLIICEYIWILLCMENSWLLHLKHILDGAIGNVNKVLKAELQRGCVSSLSAQGHKCAPRERNRIAWVVTANSRLPSFRRQAAGDRAGRMIYTLSFFPVDPSLLFSWRLKSPGAPMYKVYVILQMKKTPVRYDIHYTKESVGGCEQKP